MQPRTPRRTDAVTSFTSHTSANSSTRDFEAEQSFQDFSKQYKLQLRIPSVDTLEQSPHRQRQLIIQGREDRDATTYRRFRIHFRKRTLDTILGTYHERAKILCKKWVAKPRGEQNVTPRITAFPEATNLKEREELKQLFEKVLDEHRPGTGQTTPYSTKTLRNGREIPALPPPKDSVTRSPPTKRGPDDLSEAVTKRPKSSIFEPKTTNHSLRSEISLRPERSFSGLSTNISRETVVFSDHGQRVSQGTQTTVEASSQEKARWPPAPPRFTQDEFSVSTSSLQALEESFDNFNDKPLLHDNVRKYLDSSFVEPEPDPARITPPALRDLQKRLDVSWQAPFPIVWEVLRALLHCKVDTNTFELEYDESSWNSPRQLWRILRNDIAFAGKTLPEECTSAAWNAALSGFRLNKQAVILAANLSPSTTSTGPFFEVQLHPLKIDATHRVARRFGSDRFMELIIPSIDPKNISVLKTLPDEAITYIRRWISTNLHPMSGRFWKSFFVRSSREGPTRKSTGKSDWFEPEPKQVMRDRFYLFAQDGDDFQPQDFMAYPPKPKAITCHTGMSVVRLVQWLLQPLANDAQPSLKLFSRITLGLSRTEPTVVLDKDQFRHLDDDICSSTGNVMNDGIGRISAALAKKIRDSMGLTETPAGFQGRIGSAKGFWIIDTCDRGNEVWIETYPSQRKWNCDWDDADHRTFEVSSYPKFPGSASLNTQFLPILMERAPTDTKREALERYLRDLLIRLLNNEIEEQRIAMQDPLSCSAWVNKNSPSRRLERLQDDQVPRLGSVPRHDEDRIQFLLAADFIPLKQKYLWDMIWKLCKEKCDELKSRINIKVGRSIHAYMVIDFHGILAENEVHVSFSSNFRDELSGFSDTHLHGVDVLVARSPAHFVSDIQKVKAVFKPELGALKDVVVFPSKGDVPLADKLSGGDYDGDMAWVCWDPDIVNNFESAAVPKGPDLIKEGFISQRTESYGDLVEQHGDEATLRFLEEGFDFNMQPKFLGMCTAFKESLCYRNQSVSDTTSIRLSTMLSSLVDQGKQGIVFTAKDLSRFKKSLLKGKPEPAQPRYKSDVWTGRGNPSHIVDYLKFTVMIPAVDAELDRLNKSTDGVKAELWDEDLALYWRFYNDLRVKGNRSAAQGMTKLQDDIEAFHRGLETLRARDDVTFDAKVWQCHDKFQLIQPDGFKGTLGKILTFSHPEGKHHSEWSLLRASTYFKSFYNRSTFIWWIIGSELQEIKTKSSPGGPTVTLVASAYAAIRPDAKHISTRRLRNEGLQDSFREDVEPPDE